MTIEQQYARTVRGRRGLLWTWRYTWDGLVIHLRYGYLDEAVWVRR